MTLQPGALPTCHLRLTFRMRSSTASCKRPPHSATLSTCVKLETHDQYCTVYIFGRTGQDTPLIMSAGCSRCSRGVIQLHLAKQVVDGTLLVVLRQELKRIAARR